MGAFFQWKHCFPNFSTAVYFSFLEYTTVGSEFNLPLKWRLLEGMIATAGLLAFAWSTGVLLTLATAFQEQQLRLLNERRENGHQKGTWKKPMNPDGHSARLTAVQRAWDAPKLQCCNDCAEGPDR